MTVVDDAAFAWSCAADLLVYDADPVAHRLNLGNEVEPLFVARHDALVLIYARRLLLHCEADPQRLSAAKGESARRRRPDAPSRWGRIVDELFAAALAMVVEAGALDDMRARARLLVAVAHATDVDRLGPAVTREIRGRAARELGRRLGEIDEAHGGQEHDADG